MLYDIIFVFGYLIWIAGYTIMWIYVRQKYITINYIKLLFYNLKFTLYTWNLYCHYLRN